MHERTLLSLDRKRGHRARFVHVLPDSTPLKKIDNQYHERNDQEDMD